MPTKTLKSFFSSTSSDHPIKRPKLLNSLESSTSDDVLSPDANLRLPLIEENLLPHDGIVLYMPKVFDKSSSHCYFDALMSTIDWECDVVKVFGKTHITKRKVAFYSNEEITTYSYSFSIKQSFSWTPELLAIKSKVEEITKEKFNACLCNLYHDGNEGVAFHSDDERTIAEASTIVSVSFGAERIFRFKEKQGVGDVSLTLGNGSLLVMKGVTQRHWKHSLPKAAKITQPRISLTFRQMIIGCLK